MNKKVVIIGAGPARLTAAYELLYKSDIKPIVFEAGDDVVSVWENPNFMDEVKMIETRSRLYSASPCFECFHDGADAEKVSGWAWNKNNPGAKVAVDIFDGETLLASILAREYRQDIASYTKDNGCHAFVYELPASVKDGLPHKIRVKIRETNIDAHGTPKVFRSSSSKSGL